MVARAHLGFICGTMDLVGWLEARHLYSAFRPVLQPYWPTWFVAALVNVYPFRKTYHGTQ